MHQCNKTPFSEKSANLAIKDGKLELEGKGLFEPRIQLLHDILRPKVQDARDTRSRSLPLSRKMQGTVAERKSRSTKCTIIWRSNVKSLVCKLLLMMKGDLHRVSNECRNERANDAWAPLSRSISISAHLTFSTRMAQYPPPRHQNVQLMRLNFDKLTNR